MHMRAHMHMHMHIASEHEGATTVETSDREFPNSLACERGAGGNCLCLIDFTRCCAVLCAGYELLTSQSSID